MRAVSGAGKRGVKRVVVRNAIAVFVKHLVAWAEAAIAKTRMLKDVPEVVCAIPALFVRIVGDPSNFVKIRLAFLVVMVAVPHDMVSGGTFTMARWVIALVGGIHVGDVGGF